MVKLIIPVFCVKMISRPCRLCDATCSIRTSERDVCLVSIIRNKCAFKEQRVRFCSCPPRVVLDTDLCVNTSGAIPLPIRSLSFSLTQFTFSHLFSSACYIDWVQITTFAVWLLLRSKLVIHTQRGQRRRDSYMTWFWTEDLWFDRFNLRFPHRERMRQEWGGSGEGNQERFH